jgi:hypothetical protein
MTQDRVKIGTHTLTTLVAVTPEEQSQGLMYQPWPPPIMTFAFLGRSIHKFWMKNTPSPLDLIFCCAGKVVQIYDGQPYSLDRIGPNEPTDLVVEMPRGLAHQLGIKPGQSVSLSYSIPTLSRLYQSRLTKNS